MPFILIFLKIDLVCIQVHSRMHTPYTKIEFFENWEYHEDIIEYYFLIMILIILFCYMKIEYIKFMFIKFMFEFLCLLFRNMYVYYIIFHKYKNKEKRDKRDKIN